MKLNPIRVCSCFQCKVSSKRRYVLHTANRKFRHQNKQQLKQLSDYDHFDEILVAGGYVS